MKNKQKHICIYEEGTWETFRKEVKKVNSELFDIIEQLSPGKKYKLIRVQYPYGEYILEHGIPKLPDTSGNFFRVDAPNMPSHLKELLSYCSTPLALQLVNSGEVFLEINQSVAPLNVFLPGDMFGLFETTSFLAGQKTLPMWTITAGARTVIMVPKISDTLGHNRIKGELGIKIGPPKYLSDHWAIFRDISRKINANNPWLCEILFFTKDWFIDNNEDIGWLKFQKYLLQKSWLQSNLMRSRTAMSILWDRFSTKVEKRRLKPNSYIVATVKHLIYLVFGQNPGFKAADESELVLPSRTIENVYQNIYLLKEYAPTILHAHIWEGDEENTLYYSLAYPTLLDVAPSIKHMINANIMAELREVRVLVDILLNLLEEYDEVQYSIIKNTLFKYLHAEKDRFGELADANEAAFDDIIIKRSLEKRFAGRRLAKNGPFFKGCIELMHKNNS